MDMPKHTTLFTSKIILYNKSQFIALQDFFYLIFFLLNYELKMSFCFWKMWNAKKKSCLLYRKDIKYVICAFFYLLCGLLLFYFVVPRCDVWFYFWYNKSWIEIVKALRCFIDRPNFFWSIFKSLSNWMKNKNAIGNF
jgi:predicted small integral membrane protein